MIAASLLTRALFFTVCYSVEHRFNPYGTANGQVLFKELDTNQRVNKMSANIKENGSVDAPSKEIEDCQVAEGQRAFDLHLENEKVLSEGQRNLDIYLEERLHQTLKLLNVSTFWSKIDYIAELVKGLTIGDTGEIIHILKALKVDNKLPPEYRWTLYQTLRMFNPIDMTLLEAMWNWEQQSHPQFMDALARLCHPRIRNNTDLQATSGKIDYWNYLNDPTLYVEFKEDAEYFMHNYCSRMDNCTEDEDNKGKSTWV